MQTIARTKSMPVTNARTGSYPWLMLISRSALFILFQLLIALIAAVAGRMSGSEAWDESTRWWTFMATLANLVSLFFLVRLFRAEGKHYLDVIKFSRATFKTDLLWFIGFSLIGLPIAATPMNVLGNAIFGDRMTPIYMMFRPLPVWALVLSLFFPLTIAFAELPTYFAYVMPRLATQFRNGWTAWLIASFFLGAQHIFLPLIFDGGFMLWRLGMYMPFALFAGLLLKLRPTLLPYFMIVHAPVDISAVAVYLMI